MNEQATPAAQETPAQREKRLAIIQALSETLKEKRTAAIQWRKDSGIENIWDEDEAHYNGEDELTTGASLTKGRSTTDVVTSSVKKDTRNRSTVFLKITRPYVDAASARVSDMLLPTDDKNWAIRPTPLPQLQESMKDQRPVTDVVPPQRKAGFAGFMGKLFGGQQPQPQQPEQVAAAPVPTVAQVAAQEYERAMASAKAAEKQIEDWHVECSYHAEVRKMIESAARIGTGVLKGPVPKIYRSRTVSKTPEGWQVAIEQKVAPESRSISPRNLYPDPACGDDIHSGNFVWECDDVTARKLYELRELPGYIPETIDMVVAEGPIDAVTGTKKLAEGKRTELKDLFQIWYFHGHISREDMEAAGCKCGDSPYYPCLVTMVNDRVIRVALNPLDSGRFPYDVMVWQAQEDHWAGVGIARQMRECQKGANAAVRNLMDNAGLGAGPQIIVNRGKIIPANGKWELTPRKVWWTREDAVEDVDVTKAFTVVAIDMLQDKLMAILQMWVSKAEEVTGLPMLLQGHMGGHNPTDKVGIAQIQNNNGSTVLRRIARTFDDRVTEPHIGGYYEYLLVDPTVPDDCKGDYTIDARGSSALLERDLQNQQIPMLLQHSLNPSFGLDPELVMSEFLKGMRFDPKRMVMSDEKKEEMAKRQPPPPPQVQVAQIREQGAIERAQMEIQSRVEESGLERELKLRLKDIDAQLEQQSLTAEKERDLQKHKVALASLVMELRQQRELSPGPQVREPPTEPAGKAPTGWAYPK